jgi:hypothetical protein
MRSIKDTVESMRKDGLELDTPEQKRYFDNLQKISYFGEKIKTAEDLNNLSKEQGLELINLLSTHESLFRTSESHKKAISIQLTESRMTEFLQGLRRQAIQEGNLINAEIINKAIDLVRSGKYSSVYELDRYQLGVELIRNMDNIMWKKTYEMLTQLMETSTDKGVFL